MGVGGGGVWGWGGWGSIDEITQTTLRSCVHGSRVASSQPSKAVPRSVEKASRGNLKCSSQNRKEKSTNLLLIIGKIHTITFRDFLISVMGGNGNISSTFLSP